MTSDNEPTSDMRWRPARGVAWVHGEADGIALVDVNSAQQHAQLIRQPYARLWLAVGEPEGATAADLARIVDGVNAEAAETAEAETVEAGADATVVAAHFLSELHEAGMIEPVRLDSPQPQEAGASTLARRAPLEPGVSPSPGA